MANWSIDFDAPYYLLLLVALPLFWWVGRRSLQALGGWRRTTALVLRLAVATLIIVALAEPNWLTLINRLTVLFVVDASASVQQEELQQALAYVSAAAEQRDAARGDRAGAVVFGRDAAVEIPPVDAPWHLARIESSLDPRFTNLETALQLAAASFPPDTAKRVVIVSDGNENVGQVRTQAAGLLDSGIGIDVAPISYQRQGDVAIEKLVAPTEVRRGTPFALRVVLDNLAADKEIAGTLRIMRELGGVRQPVVEQPIVLEPGKRVLTVRQELDEAGMTTYEATFFPDNPADDIYTENNSATAFCQVRGQGRVLVVEDAGQAGRFDQFVRLLRNHDIEVTLRDTRRSWDSLADLQRFDAVILADVARVADAGQTELTHFSDQQVRQLVQNTEHLGSGLVVLGGPNSYGAGGWTNSELEKAMPVNFQIESARVETVGALVLVIDRSGSMGGEKIAWSRAAAVAAAQMLGQRDHIGVVAFDTEAQWIVPLQRNGAGQRTRQLISRLDAGGGTDMMPGLQEAYRAIQGVNASLKHVIALTDGLTPPADYRQLVSEMRGRGITTSGVAVGADADRLLLANISQWGDGKFHQVQSPNAIPRVFMREARRVAMPLVFEDPAGFGAQIVTHGELLSGISEPLPPLTGLVLTTVKQDPLVEVLLATPRQPPPNSTILATWQYGLGRAVALTTDVGQRWATDWLDWGDFDKLLVQLVRWSMRSHDIDQRLEVTSDVRDGVLHVVVNALDRDETYLNLLGLSGTVILPDGNPASVRLEQEAPGRYVGRLPVGQPGNYYLSVHGGGAAPVSTAVHVPNTAEFSRLASNDALLAQLAAGAAKDGEPGAVISSPQGLADVETLTATDVFRPGVPPAVSRDLLWPLVLAVAAVVFLGDVFCRRVRITFGWLYAVAAWLRLRRSDAAAEVEQPMERLKKTKVAATARWEDRFAGDGAPPIVPAESVSVSAQEVATSATKEAVVDAPQDAADGDESDYTSRLLAAKRRAREGR